MAPSLVISGTVASGKSTLARVLAERFSYRHLSTGDLFKAMAAERKMTTVAFLELCKKEKKIHYNLDQRMLAQLAEGDTVADGKLLVWLAPPACFTIFLDAGEQIRAERIADHDRVSIEHSLAALRDREKKERESFSAAYPDLDLTDYTHGDLVLDSSSCSTEQLVAQVLVAYEEKYGLVLEMKTRRTTL